MSVNVHSIEHGQLLIAWHSSMCSCVNNSILICRLKDESFRVHELLALYHFCEWDAQSFVDTTFASGYQTSKLVKVFSLENFPLYGMYGIAQNFLHPGAPWAKIYFGELFY